MNEETKLPTTNDPETAEDKGRCAPAPCSDLSHREIATLHFRAVKPPNRKYWMAYLEDRGVLIPNIVKPTRQKLWEELENIAKLRGHRFVSECYLI